MAKLGVFARFVTAGVVATGVAYAARNTEPFKAVQTFVEGVIKNVLPLDEPKNNSTPQPLITDIYGQYKCEPPQVAGKFEGMKEPPKSDIYLYLCNFSYGGNASLTSLNAEAVQALKSMGSSDAMLAVMGHSSSAHVTGNSFFQEIIELRNPQISSNTVRGQFDNGTMVVVQKIMTKSGAGATFSFSCQKTGVCPSSDTKAPENAKLPEDGSSQIKAVFMRPCPGQLYTKFPTQSQAEVSKKGKIKKADWENYKGLVAVGNGTIKGVCTDLKDSGVTDVFLPFKVDHAGKGCGEITPAVGTIDGVKTEYGELLYSSMLHPDRISPPFRAALDIGFDPLGALIHAKSCKGIRFHAWFPVFKDGYAAQIAKQKAVKDKGPLGFLDPSPPEEKLFDYFADPVSEVVAAYQLELLAEIVAKYPVVGINLDYVRYTDDPLPDGYALVKDPYAVSHFVRVVREKFPTLKLSADVMAGEPRRIAVGQNDVLPLLDLVMLMAYTDPSKGADSSKNIPDWIQIANQTSGRKVLPLLRGWRLDSQNVQTFLTDLRADVNFTAATSAAGYGFFTYESLLEDGSLKTLKSFSKSTNP